MKTNDKKNAKLYAEIDVLIAKIKGTPPKETRKIAELKLQIRLREATIAYTA